MITLQKLMSISSICLEMRWFLIAILWVGGLTKAQKIVVVKQSTTGRSDYGCRWNDGGYGYAAIVGSKGQDNIWVKKKSDGTQPVQIWGSVELGASNDCAADSGNIMRMNLVEIFIS